MKLELRHGLAGLLIGMLWCSLVTTTAQGTRGQLEIRARNALAGSEFFYEGSYALLIGNADYQAGAWPDLTTITNELEGLKEALVQQSFEIFQNRVHLNLNETEMESVVEAFVESPGARNRNARLLFYYAGHGHTQEGSGFLVTRDAPDPKQDLDGFENSAVWISDFRQWARKARAKHVLFCFDSCFAGTVFQSRNRTAPEEISLLTQSPVREFLTAGGADEEVPARGLFTEFFKLGIEGLGDLDKNGYVTGTELFSYLRSKVAAATFNTTRNEVQFGKLPDPRYQKGDFVFVSRTPLASGRIPTPAQVPLYGGLLIKSPQAGTVSLNGAGNFRVVEGKGLEWKELPVGRYEVEVRNEKGEAFRKVVLVREGKRSELAVEFPRDVASQPKAGDVRNDNTLGMPMVYCPPGRFTMGSPTSETGRESNEDQVSVTLSQGFWLGQYEVRWKDWDQFVRAKGYRTEAEREGDDSTWKNRFAWGDDYPVMKISWNDAVAFCEWLTETERKAGRLGSSEAYRLPSEAQWEYACRAGTTGMSYQGDFEIKGTYNAPKLGRMAWYGGNSGVTFADGYDNSGWLEKEENHRLAGTHPVGQKLANPWGLHDMLGNVREWTSDWYDEDLKGGTNPTGASSGKYRVNRGGCWSDFAVWCRSATRIMGSPSHRFFFVGFRVARVPFH